MAQCLAHIEYSKTLVEQWVSEWTAGFVWSMTKLWNFEAQGWSKGFFQVDLRNWSWSPSQSQWKQLWPRLPLLDLCPHQKSQCKARSGSLSLISQRMFASLSWKSQIKLLPDTFKSQFFFSEDLISREIIIVKRNCPVTGWQALCYMFYIYNLTKFILPPFYRGGD